MRNQELVKMPHLKMHHHHKDSTVLASFSDCSTTSVKEQHYQLKISRTKPAEGVRNTDYLRREQARSKTQAVSVQ